MSYERDKIITIETQEGLNILRTISKATNIKQIEELDLINRLRKANEEGWTNGCGLSAIQIGIPLRVAYLIIGGREEILINPETIFRVGRFKFKEGCLSIPEKWIEIERYEEIEYMSDGKKKRAKGLKAVAIQHEIDHMDGILIIDKLG